MAFEKKAYILAARDRDGLVFSRMLALELSGLGYSCTESDMIPKKGESELVIADADALNDAEINALFGLSVPIFLYSANDVEKHRKNAAAVFKRPFEISKLAAAINRIYGTDPVFASDGTKSGSYGGGEKEQSAAVFEKSGELPAVNIDKKRGCAVVGENVIPLTAKEFELLSLLVSRRGKVVSKQEIAKLLWDISPDQSNITEVYIRYLRKKLDDRFGVKLILTVRGEGYTVK